MDGGAPRLTDEVDVAIVGGGVVGCAVAATLAARGRQVMVLERARGLGTGVTSRNSGVIHSGLYYPPGSRKATTCVRGNRQLYAWAAARGVWHARTGKLVVAQNAAQVDELERLQANARACEAPGVTLISGAEVTRREPSLVARAGLLCADSGIVEVHELMLSLRAAAEADGALFVLGANLEAVSAERGGHRLCTTRGELHAGRVVNAAGLEADHVARLFGVAGPTIHPCRGDYFRLRPRVAYRHLVYPVKDPTAPGLGVHLTLERGGGCRLGPDAEYVSARDDFAPAAHKHAAFLAAAQRLLGPIAADDVSYDSCGIRPKLRAPGESDERDFVVCEEPAGVVHFIGIESPGLTAALALAESEALAAF